MKTLAAILLCAVAALITLATFAVQGWMLPIQPMLLGCGLIALPSILAMFALEPAARRAPWSLAAITVISSLIIGLVLPSLWFSPNVRLAAIARTTDQTAFLAALDDVSNSVQIRACQRLFETDARAAEIASELTSRPSLAAKCLVGDSNAQRSVAARVVANWQQRLKHDAVDSCVEAETATQIQGVDTVALGIGFLDCALSANQPDARICCINQLTHLKSKDHVGEWIQGSRSEIQRRQLTATALLVSHGEPGTMKDQNPGVAQIGLNSPAMRYMTLSQACEALVRGEDARSVMSGIDWVFAQHESCLSEEERTTSLDTIDACRLIIAGEFQDLERQICAANQYSRREELARSQAAAERTANSDFGSLAENIVAGDNRLSNQASLNGFVDAAMGGGEGLKNLSDADLARIRNGISAQVATAPTKESIKKLKNDDRMQELRDDPKTKELFNMKTPADVAKMKAAFEAREKAALKKGKK